MSFSASVHTTESGMVWQRKRHSADRKQKANHSKRSYSFGSRLSIYPFIYPLENEERGRTFTGLSLQGLQGSPASLFWFAALTLAISRHLKMSSFVW